METFNSNITLEILYNNIEKIPVDKVIQINNKIYGAIQSTKISHNRKGMSFRVEVKKGEKWKINHQDCDQVILIYKGKLKELTTNTIATRNTFIEFAAGVKHELIAQEDSIFYVEFKNPKKLINNDRMANTKFI